jgi:hypothetical protein
VIHVTNGWDDSDSPSARFGQYSIRKQTGKSNLEKRRLRLELPNEGTEDCLEKSEAVAPQAGAGANWHATWAGDCMG